MKAIRIIVFFFTCFFIFAGTSFAHLAGQPAYLIINGKYVGLYTVPTTSLNNFPLPQDHAPENYLGNQPIQFEIDARKLPGVTSEVLQKTKFTWKLGDGTNAEGLRVIHTYMKIGSYLIEIYTDDGTSVQPQLLESVLLHVLPNKDYKLPVSVITVNGKKSKDPLIDTLSYSFEQPLYLSAEDSKVGSSGIKSYFWDLGDGINAAGKIQRHTYKHDLRIVFPVLRVTDENGFISDSFLQVNNQIYDIQGTVLKKTGVTPAQKQNKPEQLRYGALIIFFLICTTWIVMFIRKRRTANIKKQVKKNTIIRIAFI